MICDCCDRTCVTHLYINEDGRDAVWLCDDCVAELREMVVGTEMEGTL